MARLCAKPACSSAAASFFEVDAANRTVVEHARATLTTLALCDSHAERFSVPDGWTWSKRNDVASDVPLASEHGSGEKLIEALAAAGTTPADPPSARRHSRDQPWFLAGSATTTDVGSATESVSTASATQSAANDESVESEVAMSSEPSAGSLLHRAFHGPDRATDVVRAKSAERDTSPKARPADAPDGTVAKVRDIESGRRSRSVTSYDVELPFPPAESSPHVAV